MTSKLLSTISFCFITLASFAQVVVVKDADVDNGVTNWTADNEYHLDGYVFVENGGTLNIEAGTVIKGLAGPSTGDVSSALIVANGAKIYAEGTAEKPIIFTAEFDDVDVPDDLFAFDKGLWGGVIILGVARVGVDGGTANIEGIPSTEGRASYGGNINDDDSGVLKYVSIRHGGAKLEANNEINGLTLGGVGSKTVIDYVEVFANLDDGIEWFGGTVDVKHALVSFCGDDSYDYDQSWDGRGQYWFSLQDEVSNRAGEWDGSEAADLKPQVSPTLSNITFIGGGPASVNEDDNDAMRIRDDGAVHLWNSIIYDFAKRAIVIDNDAVQDSYQRFMDGDITFHNNVFNVFGAGSNWEDIVSTDGGDDNLLVQHLIDNGNVIGEYPGMAGVSRTQGSEELDPRINGTGAAFMKGIPVEGDNWFEPTTYCGAFGSITNWAEGWTALSDNLFFGSLVSATDDPTDTYVDRNMQVYPNPVIDMTNVSMHLENSMILSVEIIDVQGQVVSQPISREYFGAGENNVELNLQQLAAGTYLVVVREAGAIAGRRIIIKN